MEIWKDIKGYEGHYQISSYGRVRSLDKEVNSALRHNEKVIKKGKILKLNLKRNGYLSVDLCVGNIKKTKSVHRMVATAFIDKTDGLDVVNHKNMNKTDNRVDNLEWCTDKYNSQHAFKNGAYDHLQRKKVKCLNNNKVFDSSYKAAEWVNEYVYKNSNVVKNIASKIRSCCLGYQKTSSGFKWKYLD